MIVVYFFVYFMSWGITHLLSILWHLFLLWLLPLRGPASNWPVSWLACDLCLRRATPVQCAALVRPRMKSSVVSVSDPKIPIWLLWDLNREIEEAIFQLEFNAAFGRMQSIFLKTWHGALSCWKAQSAKSQNSFFLQEITWWICVHEERKCFISRRHYLPQTDTMGVKA